ncbi:unnamed protein product [Boreogadus saida]
MADMELWNKVNIPFPSAASSVKINSTILEGADIRWLLKKNDTVLGLLKSHILQTEIRVLYELLFSCKNNHGTNLTFRALKQVEQCINRLKEMKLDAALLNLADCCASRFKSKIYLASCDSSCPSQPMLEWVSLKVLGAARLLACVMDYCTRSFTRARQQLKQDEFIVLSVVISGMVSRLWVYFRAMVVALVPLYGQIQILLATVSQAQPMPFLTGHLPTNLTQFIGPSWSSLITKGFQFKSDWLYNTLAPSNPGLPPTDMNSHDVGVALQRVHDVDGDQSPSIKIFKNVRRVVPVQDPMPSSFSWKSEQGEQERVFLAQVRSAATCKDLATHLKEMIAWCVSQKRKREKPYFSFLHLKSRRLERLELAGNGLQRKLRRLKDEVCWVLSPSDPFPASCHSLSTLWRRTHPKNCFQPIRSRLRTTGARVKVGAQREPQLVRRQPKQGRRTCNTTNVSASSGQDEIDDIFSSLDF